MIWIACGCAHGSPSQVANAAPAIDEHAASARSDEEVRWTRPLLDLRLTSLPREPVRAWRPQPVPVAAPRPEWFHPLAGPSRALPANDSRRFGAARPQPRPAECELGHCGVDLGTTAGEPVFAVFDGVIERIERDETRATNPADARAGRFVRIGHENGTMVTRYLHLDSIRADLSEGDRVRGGEMIGRLGSTGISTSGPHLHFSLSLREGAAERYIDPEPLLRSWRLPSPATIEIATTATATATATATPATTTVSRVEPTAEAPHWIWTGSGWRGSEADARSPTWIPPHWMWMRGGWLWIAGAGPSPPHWQWHDAGWVWVAGAWRQPG